MQRLTGATVIAGQGNLATLASGKAGPDDPQYGNLNDFEPVAKLRGVDDGEIVKLGPLTVTAHATPGHTLGGVSWTWQSCVSDRCESLAFGDSLSAISADGYRFTDHPDIVASLHKSFVTYETMPCDILVTAHPEANDLMGRLQRQAREGNSAFIDPDACRNVAAGAREHLNKRLASEKK